MSEGELRDEGRKDTGSACGPTGKVVPDRLGGPGRSFTRMVLLVGTPFDLFSLEEVHRLREVVRREYSVRDLGFVPVMDLARDPEDAMKMLRRTRYDLVILFKPHSIGEVEDILNTVGGESSSTQVACVLSMGTDMERSFGTSLRRCDMVMVWEDDPELFPVIFTLGDDRSRSLSNSAGLHKRPAVMVREADPKAFSRVCSAAHRVVWDLTLRNMSGDLSHEERLERAERRPMVLFPRTMDDDGIPSWVRPACILSPSMSRGDRRLSVHSGFASVPVLCREDLAEGESLGNAAKRFIEMALGMAPPSVDRGDGSDPVKVEDLRTLEILFGSLPARSLSSVLKEGSIQRWLMGIGEIELLEMMEEARDRDLTGTDRDTLALAIRKRRFDRSRTGMTSYDRSPGSGKGHFSRIGRGAMGGKARSLHFMDRLLEANFPGRVFEGISIRVPRTFVICTDMFEMFISQNGLSYSELERLPDERLVQAFLSSDLPPLLLGDLRAVIDELEGPIVIRSSSLLEDALFQPFAGIYASVMLSNSQMERDQRFENLCTAIKYVYASTYLSRARAYIRSTDNDPSAERMSVMVQQVVGRKRGDHFYPAFSGVGRSYDYWPQGECAPGDGCVNMTIGLGKSIVDGGASHRFCPIHPRMRAIASSAERLSCSQRGFYAVRSFYRVRRTEFDEDSQLALLDIGAADPEVLDLGCSTYSYENDRFHPGAGRDGPLSVDLAPILEEGVFPLAPLLSKVLDLGQRSLGSPVEIEFALELEGGGPVFHLLQMRSMVPRGGDRPIDLGPGRGEKVLECSRCLGNGIYRSNDIIMVRDRELGDGPTGTVRKEVTRLNSVLAGDGRGYILIGPGRWGSCDPWLGVPVTWSDIFGVKVMVEVPAGDRHIDPSQGSHFFQNITSLKLGYMMLSTEEDRKADWERLTGQLRVMKDGPVVHLRSDRPVEVRLDGRSGRGIIVIPPPDDVGTESAPLTGEDDWKGKEAARNG